MSKYVLPSASRTGAPPPARPNGLCSQSPRACAPRTRRARLRPRRRSAFSRPSARELAACASCIATRRARWASISSRSRPLIPFFATSGRARLEQREPARARRRCGVPRQIAEVTSRVDRGNVWPHRVSPGCPRTCWFMAGGDAALKAEVAKLRRQLSKRREVAVWRELRPGEEVLLTELPPRAAAVHRGLHPVRRPHGAQGADVPRDQRRRAQRDQGAAVLHRGRDARWAHRWGAELVGCGAWRRRPTAASSAARATGPSRCGAMAHASASSRRTQTMSTRWRCCRWSALRQRLGRRQGEAGRSAVPSSAPSRWACACSASRRCPTACTLWSALAMLTPGEVRLYHVDGTLVHTFKGHINVATRWR